MTFTLTLTITLALTPDLLCGKTLLRLDAIEAEQN